MKQKNKSLLKNIGLFTIGSFGSKLLGFIMIPLYTSVLNASEYGSVDLISTTAQLLMPILLLSIQDATLRFGMDSEYEKEDVLSTTFNIIIKGSVILLLGIIFVEYFKIFNISMVYYAFLFLTFVFNSINHNLNLYLKAKNNASIIAVSGIICTFVTCTSNIILLLVFKTGILGYMISNVIGVLVQIIFQFVVGKVYRELKFRGYNDLSKPMVRYSAPLIANSVAWWINNVSDRYILTWLKGATANGIYAIAYKIPSILSIFQSIFFNAWSISAIQEFDENDSDGFIGTNYSIYSFVSISVCSALLLMNIPIARILYKGGYFDAWMFVPFLLVGTVFNGIAQFEGSLYAATKNTKLVATTTVIGALVNTVCNFTLIYIWGAIGASLSTLVGYFVTWLLRTVYLQRFVKMKVKWINHYISLLVLFVQSVFATLKEFAIFQMISFAVIVMLNRRFIMVVLKRIIRKKS